MRISRNPYQWSTRRIQTRRTMAIWQAVTTQNKQKQAKAAKIRSLSSPRKVRVRKNKDLSLRGTVQLPKARAKWTMLARIRARQRPYWKCKTNWRKCYLQAAQNLRKMMITIWRMMRMVCINWMKGLVVTMWAVLLFQWLTENTRRYFGSWKRSAEPTSNASSKWSYTSSASKRSLIRYKRRTTSTRRIQQSLRNKRRL